MVLICYLWQPFDPEKVRFEQVLAVKTALDDRGRRRMDPEAPRP